MNYVSIDGMSGADIDRALDEAFRAVTGAVPIAGRYGPVDAKPKLTRADMEFFGKVKALSDAGKSVAETAKALGVRSQRISNMRRQYGLRFRQHRGGSE